MCRGAPLRSNGKGIGLWGGQGRGQARRSISKERGVVSWRGSWPGAPQHPNGIRSRLWLGECCGPARRSIQKGVGSSLSGEGCGEVFRREQAQVEPRRLADRAVPRCLFGRADDRAPGPRVERCTRVLGGLEGNVEDPPPDFGGFPPSRAGDGTCGCRATRAQPHPSLGRGLTRTPGATSGRTSSSRPRPAGVGHAAEIPRAFAPGPRTDGRSRKGSYGSSL